LFAAPRPNDRTQSLGAGQHSRKPPVKTEHQVYLLLKGLDAFIAQNEKTAWWMVSSVLLKRLLAG
jgi:hypothetical protein